MCINSQQIQLEAKIELLESLVQESITTVLLAEAQSNKILEEYNKLKQVYDCFDLYIRKIVSSKAILENELNTKNKLETNLKLYKHTLVVLLGK